MKEFLKRLTSRKFLLALGGAITLVANGAYGEAVSLIIAYILAEGAKDAIQAGNTGVETSFVSVNDESHNIKEDDGSVNRTVVTGNTPMFDEKEKDEE